MNNRNLTFAGNWRLAILLFFLVLVAVGLGVRLFYLQVLTSDRRVQLGVDQRLYEDVIEGERGRILDRNGNQLAMSFPQPVITADPVAVGDNAIKYSQLLAPILERESKYLLGNLTKPNSRFQYLKRDDVSLEMSESVKSLDLVGVYINEEPQRFHTAGEYFARGTLGIVGVDNNGISGLEQQYDKYLAGQPGLEIAERNQYGGTIPNGRIQIEPATQGADVYLTLDRGLQGQVELELGAAIENTNAQGGVVIITKPATGEILAMASMVRTEEDEIVTTSDNRAVTWIYEPASVMKAVTFAAVLNEGLAHPNTIREIDDEIELYDEEQCAGFRDEDCTFRELGISYGTQEMSVGEILIRSSNTGTITWALDLGKENLYDYLIDFGFNEKSDLNFPYEADGILERLDNWSGVSLATIAMGHGISVTPIQMLNAYSTLANGGVYVSPQIVQSISRSSGDKEYVTTNPSHRVVSEQTAREMTQMLTAVVAYGTAKEASVPGYEIAAKTGTGRKLQSTGNYEDEEGFYHYASTVVGYFPAADPELSMIVIIDEPTGKFYASETAAPLFGELAGWALRHYMISPSANLVFAAPNQEDTEDLATSGIESAAMQ